MKQRIVMAFLVLGFVAMIVFNLAEIGCGRVKPGPIMNVLYWVGVVYGTGNLLFLVAAISAVIAMEVKGYVKRRRV